MYLSGGLYDHTQVITNYHHRESDFSNSLIGEGQRDHASLWYEVEWSIKCFNSIYDGRVYLPMWMG